MSNNNPIRCPKCGSTKIKSGKLMGHGAEKAVHGGISLSHAMHNPVIGLAAGAAWLIGKAIDSANHEWVCGACQHAFSSGVG